jgi:hypothetical protein
VTRGKFQSRKSSSPVFTNAQVNFQPGGRGNLRDGAGEKINSRLKHFQKNYSREPGMGRSDRAPASWTAAALCRFSTDSLATQSGRGLPQSKTSRICQTGFQNTATVLINLL